MHHYLMKNEYFSYRDIIMLYCNITGCNNYFFQKEDI